MCTWCKDKSKTVWCIKDGCGIACVIATWFLIVFAEVIISLVLLDFRDQLAYSVINQVIFSLGVILALSSHFKAVTTNPGAVPLNNISQDKVMLQPGETINKCDKCHGIKPVRAHHCSVCKRCIRKMDHHCPWINNCVGEANQKFFVLFTFYTAMISLHSLIIIALRLFRCWMRTKCGGLVSAGPIFSVIMLIFVSLVFFFFTTSIFSSQMSSIRTNVTGIETLKRERYWYSQEEWVNLKAVFGDKFSVKWFSPFHAPAIPEDRVYQLPV